MGKSEKTKPKMAFGTLVKCVVALFVLPPGSDAAPSIKAPKWVKNPITLRWENLAIGEPERTSEVPAAASDSWSCFSAPASEVPANASCPNRCKNKLSSCARRCSLSLWVCFKGLAKWFVKPACGTSVTKFDLFKFFLGLLAVSLFGAAIYAVKKLSNETKDHQYKHITVVPKWAESWAKFKGPVLFGTLLLVLITTFSGLLHSSVHGPSLPRFGYLLSFLMGLFFKIVRIVFIAYDFPDFPDVLAFFVLIEEPAIMLATATAMPIMAAFGASFRVDTPEAATGHCVALLLDNIWKCVWVYLGRELIYNNYCLGVEKGKYVVDENGKNNKWYNSIFRWTNHMGSGGVTLFFLGTHLFDNSVQNVISMKTPGWTGWMCDSFWDRECIMKVSEAKTLSDLYASPDGKVNTFSSVPVDNWWGPMETRSHQIKEVYPCASKCCGALRGPAVDDSDLLLPNDDEGKTSTSSWLDLPDCVTVNVVFQKAPFGISGSYWRKFPVISWVVTGLEGSLYRGLLIPGVREVADDQAFPLRAHLRDLLKDRADELEKKLERSTPEDVSDRSKKCIIYGFLLLLAMMGCYYVYKKKSQKHE